MPLSYLDVPETERFLLCEFVGFCFRQFCLEGLVGFVEVLGVESTPLSFRATAFEK